MAIQSQPSRIPEPFAGSGSKNVIPATNATPSASQAASWASGFPPECSQPISAGGCPVPRNDVNGALNQLSQDFAFRQDGGIWQWSALADYDTQRMVRGSNGLLYWSVAQSGPSLASGAVDPTTDDGTYWQVMPVADAGLVHIAGAETITGVKTFENGVGLVIPGGNPEDLTLTDVGGQTALNWSSPRFVINEARTSAGGLFTVRSKYNNEDTPAENIYTAFRALTNDDVESGRLLFSRNANGSGVGWDIDICFFGSTQRSSFGFYYGTTDNSTYRYVYTPKETRTFRPNVDKFTSLGTGSFRWTQLYAGTATISTSDERLKTSIETVPDEVLDAWGDVDFFQFQMKDAVAEKGAAARIHSGVIAQRVDSVFKAHGLDAARYALFCYDQWEDIEPLRDEEGNELAAGQKAGDAYSIRYEEALCMEAAYQRRRADRAEARLAALEERLAAIEARIDA